MKWNYSLRPGPDPRDDYLGLGRVQKPTFSEYGHAAHKIKWNESYDNIKQVILPLHTPGFKWWKQFLSF